MRMLEVLWQDYAERRCADATPEERERVHQAFIFGAAAFDVLLREISGAPHPVALQMAQQLRQELSGALAPTPPSTTH
ncbi:MAG TPA: hypothetical protein VNR18_02000 [Hyphomicrobiales bacterium]|nr:hypothetical protein [Hyphomicrobiales bacterium]